METRTIYAAQPGSDRVYRPWRRRRAPTECSSPDCDEEISEGRFCTACQSRLDGIRAELEAEAEARNPRTLGCATRGLNAGRLDEAGDAAEVEPEPGAND